LHIYTWSDYRRDLARNKFAVLRTAAGTGSFVMREDLLLLQPPTLERQTLWFADFDIWQAEAFWSDLQTHAKSLAANKHAAIAKLGKGLESIVAGSPAGASASAFIAISQVADEVQSLISRLKDETDSKIRSAIAREVTRDKTPDPRCRQ
jgi:hypothetical protein